MLEFGAGHGRFAFAYPGLGSYLGVDSSQNLVALGNRQTWRLAVFRFSQRFMGLFQDVTFASREFPWLAEHYAKSRSAWPLRLRNGLARSSLARPLATEAWVFARRP